MRNWVCRGLLLGMVMMVSGGKAQAQDPLWANKMFEKLEHDFGKVPTGAELKYRLKIKNVYQQTVRISGVGSNCGCTVGKPAKDTLASEESTYIDISMDTRKFVGPKEVLLTVTFNQPLLASVVIPVRAFHNPDIAVNPGTAGFGAVAKGTESQRHLAIVYNGHGRSVIKDAVSKSPNVLAKVVETGRNGFVINYDLLVTLKGTTPLGELREQVTVTTDDPANPTIPVLVEARVEPEYVITPEIVLFGNLAPGERKTLNIVARGKKAFLIEKIESDKTAGVFEVRLPKDAKTLHVLPLTMIAPKEVPPTRGRWEPP